MSFFTSNCFGSNCGFSPLHHQIMLRPFSDSPNKSCGFIRLYFFNVTRSDSVKFLSILRIVGFVLGSSGTSIALGSSSSNVIFLRFASEISPIPSAKAFWFSGNCLMTLSCFFNDFILFIVVFRQCEN